MHANVAGTLEINTNSFDDDVDLDLADYAAFQSAFTGPTAPNLNPDGLGVSFGRLHRLETGATC